MDKSKREELEKFLLDSINAFEGPLDEKDNEKAKEDIKNLSDDELKEKCDFADYLYEK